MERPPATVINALNGNPIFGPFAEKNLNKDVSFSSYLRPEPPPVAAAQDDAGCLADDSDQISVFDAENYFSESSEKESKRSSVIGTVNLDGFSMVSRPSSVSVSSFNGYGRNFRKHSFHETPTASSEASWNSQTGLLSNPPGAIAVSLRNLSGDGQTMKGGSRSVTTWFSRRRCPCSGKKSVQVEEKIAETSRSPSVSHSRKQSQSQSQNQSEPGERPPPEKTIPNLRRITSSQSPFPSGMSHQNGFSFPILNQSSKMVIKAAINPSASVEEPPRESLEVFQPPSMEVQSLDRRAFGFPVSPISRVTATDDDVASDASSDLFEIESFSTQPSSSNPLFRMRDSLDEAATFNPRKLGAAAALCRDSLDEPATSSVAATECYEPSEASIDWSVTTAEGFANFSDIEDYSSSIMRRQHIKTTAAVTARRPSGSGGLLNCRCEKAVSVGPQPVKCAQHDGGRAAAGSQKVVVGGGKPPLGAARLSLAFAT